MGACSCGLTWGVDESDPHGPSIGARCLHKGRPGEIRAIYPGINNTRRVVGAYTDADESDDYNKSRFVDDWDNCKAL